MPTVSVKIIPPVPLKRDINKIHIKKDSTVYDLVDLLYKLYLTSEKRYHRDGRWVNVLWGYLLYKNHKVIGAFDQNGFKAYKDADITLNDGDEIMVILPVGGG